MHTCVVDVLADNVLWVARVCISCEQRPWQPFIAHDLVQVGCLVNSLERQKVSPSEEESHFPTVQYNKNNVSFRTKFRELFMVKNLGSQHPGSLTCVHIIPTGQVDGLGHEAQAPAVLWRKVLCP